jgi:PAS domain S-box-containing protein
LRLALEAGEFGTWEWDQSTGLVRWDERLEEIYGYSKGTFPSTFEAWRGTLHRDDQDEVLARVQQAMATRSRYTTEHRIVRPDGSVRWVESRGQVLLGPDGDVRGTTGCVRDVTDTKLAEADRLRMDRSERLLASASEQLAQSLDVDEVLAASAALTVPGLADLIAVHIVNTDNGALELSLLRHAQADAELAFRRIIEALSADIDAPLARTVVTTGQPVLMPQVTDDLLKQLSGDPDDLDQLRALRVTSLVSVPLTARGRNIGSLTLVRQAPEPYSTTELGTVGELARRVAMALDNAFAYARERMAALTLQRSLLPHIAVVAGIDIHASYLPGAEGTEVGGDWYDVIARPDGSTVLGIGDVMGRGITAAALMGQVSTAARAFALAGLGPADLLGRLDGIVAERGEGQIVTCCYAVLSPDASELVIASAGHPPPLVAQADGRVAYLELPVDVPLGAQLVGEGGALNETTVALAVGSVLAFFTDGLIESRHHSLDVGLDNLLAAISPAAGPLAQLSERVLRVRETTSQDDVALLLLRV